MGFSSGDTSTHSTTKIHHGGVAAFGMAYGIGLGSYGTVNRYSRRGIIYVRNEIKKPRCGLCAGRASFYGIWEFRNWFWFFAFFFLSKCLDQSRFHRRGGLLDEKRR